MAARSKGRQTQPSPGDNAAPTGAHAPVIPDLTLDERQAHGEAARAQVARESHAAWEPPAQRPDPIALLEEQAQSRVTDLGPIRYGRMLASPFAFFRGAAIIMASDLATTARSGIEAQLCGDAHLANFGGFTSPERDHVFDINDFDETLPGPWEWDVKRLAASIEIAGRSRGFTERERQLCVLGAVEEYRRAMSQFATLTNLAVWYAKLDVAGIRRRWGQEARAKDLKRLRQRVEEARARDNEWALERLTRVVDGKLQIISSPPLTLVFADFSGLAAR